jgi:uncharacterized integral membrane protein
MAKRCALLHETAPEPEIEKENQTKRLNRIMSIMERQTGDRNYISVGAWMGMMFVSCIPVINLIMVLVWAFAGENESRKNYFRAILAWTLIMVVLWAILVGIIIHVGGMPAVQKFIEDHQVAQSE